MALTLATLGCLIVFHLINFPIKLLNFSNYFPFFIAFCLFYFSIALFPQKDPLLVSDEILQACLHANCGEEGLENPDS